MAADIIMEMGVYLFFILFAFLLFIFLTACIAIFKKQKYPPYEPSVSVIIPCYNAEATIEKCLAAVYALKYPRQKLEVIVINDGSTDRTSSLLGECRKRYRALQVIQGKHEGKSHSLNLGVQKASHEIIFAVDADTFLHQDSLAKLVRPLQSPKIGATNGSCVAENGTGLLSIFQNVEYHYNNLIRKSFSSVFGNAIWFFGAFACYKKSVLKKIGGFKKDTLTEDMDTAMEIYSHGYRTLNVSDAIGYTSVPENLSQFYRQRTRWSVGGLQTLHKHRALFSRKSNPSILFLFISQYWWTLYSLISLPILLYQVYYWLPSNTQSTLSLFLYLFRWFSLAGIVYVLYKIPVWGISPYSIFGVLSGVISLFLIVWALYLFKDRLHLKNSIGIFFYFPYTIILNSILAISLISMVFLKKRYFIA